MLWSAAILVPAKAAARAAAATAEANVHSNERMSTRESGVHWHAY